MPSQWYTTLEESRAQFGGYQVNPEKPTERVLSRIFLGISKAAFPDIRADIDSTSELTNPLVDNQVYYGTWRIKDIRTQDGTGELAGSLTVIQDIANELNDGAGPDNEYLAGLQSDALELTEYQWMKYTHFLKRTTKKWVNLSQSSAEDTVEYLSKIHIHEGLSLTPSFLLIGIPGTYKVVGSSTVITSTWSSKYWNAVYRRLAGEIIPEAYFIVDQVGEPGNITKLTEQGSPPYGTCTYNLTLTGREISQPHIESVRMQEERDHSFTVYRTMTELTYPAVMREIYLQYAGLVKTSEMPVDGTNTIKLSGFLNQTEQIYQNARFRIGGDTYTVTADATCVDGAVTLAVTPTVTLATSDAHLADVSNPGARAFFNAIGG